MLCRAIDHRRIRYRSRLHNRRHGRGPAGRGLCRTWSRNRETGEATIAADDVGCGLHRAWLRSMRLPPHRSRCQPSLGSSAATNSSALWNRCSRDFLHRLQNHLRQRRWNLQLRFHLMRSRALRLQMLQHQRVRSLRLKRQLRRDHSDTAPLRANKYPYARLTSPPAFSPETAPETYTTAFPLPCRSLSSRRSPPADSRNFAISEVEHLRSFLTLLVLGEDLMFPASDPGVRCPVCEPRQWPGPTCRAIRMARGTASAPSACRTSLTVFPLHQLHHDEGPAILGISRSRPLLPRRMPQLARNHCLSLEALQKARIFRNVVITI